MQAVPAVRVTKEEDADARQSLSGRLPAAELDEDNPIPAHRSKRQKSEPEAVDSAPGGQSLLEARRVAEATKQQLGLTGDAQACSICQQPPIRCSAKHVDNDRHTGKAFCK